VAFGALVMYWGVAVLIGSPGAAVLLGAGSLPAYIERVEEGEMEIRFGEVCLEYKRRTPFLIPRLRREH
jgi:protein-S-isoprenylcysteine O-methyltransferase Ste14